MADILAAGAPYPMLTEEPQQCAETMLGVLESLWKLRAASPEWRARAEAEIKRAPS
jgi:hypothetical protein